MNRLRPRAIDEGTPCSALTVYSSASQSPMNGSRKSRIRIRAIAVGGSHQRHRESSVGPFAASFLKGGLAIFHFPFSIFHLAFGNREFSSHASDSMKKGKLENDKWKIRLPSLTCWGLHIAHSIKAVNVPVIGSGYYSFEHGRV